MYQLQTLYSCKWDIIMKQNKLIKVWSYLVGRCDSRLVLILDTFSSNVALISATTSIFLSLSRRTPWSSRWKSLPIHGYHYTYIIRQPYNLYSWTASLNIFKNHEISDSYRDRRDGAHKIVLMMERVSTSETSVKFYKTTQPNIADEKTSSV
jgi:hypothetical protein